MSARPLTAFAIAMLVPFAASASKLTVLHSFGPGDGVHPHSGFAADDKGNLYGTTLHGGDFQGGTIYKITRKGKETVLYSFQGGTDGAYPAGTPMRDADGNLYVTTTGGDVSSDFGTVVRLTPKGKEKVLYRFANTPDGCFPQSELLPDAAGTLYGTASACAVGAGSVFKITPSGKFDVVYAFTNGADGANPPAGLIADAAGALYSTTYNGGLGWGTVFKVTTGGTHTVLYSFTGGADGRNPSAGLVTDGKGSLYGTTYFGGTADRGVLFKLDKNGETVLHDFAGGNDGANPLGTLIVDAKGNLYGTASQGGTNGAGTIFEITKSGAFKVLYRFKEPGQVDGANPAGDLFLAADGTIYGTTENGGDHASGTVFKLTPN